MKFYRNYNKKKLHFINLDKDKRIMTFFLIMDRILLLIFKENPLFNQVNISMVSELKMTNKIQEKEKYFKIMLMIQMI